MLNVNLDDIKDIRTSVTEQFRENIQDSIDHSKFYELGKGSEYELGFMGHSGMVSRVWQVGLESWLGTNTLGRTCILDISCDSRDRYYFSCNPILHDVVCSLTSLNEIIRSGVCTGKIRSEEDMCVYIPRTVILGDGYTKSLGSVDIIYSRLPRYYSGYKEYNSCLRLRNRIQLAIHAAACNRVDNLVIADYNDALPGDEVRIVAQAFKDISEIYSCYISNVIYLIPDEDNYRIYKSIVSGN